MSAEQQAQLVQVQYKTTSNLAIAAFILSLFFWPMGLILGPLALREIKANPTLTGRGLAIWGTIVSICGALIIPILIVVLVTAVQSSGGDWVEGLPPMLQLLLSPEPVQPQILSVP